jgi:hypothetical protein
VRLTVAPPITLRPALLATHIALRTIAEALTIAATRKLDIEATELQAEYRPALTPFGSEGLEAEIYLYDTLAGGAGFARQVNAFGLGIFKQALDLLENCPDGCDESCYRCLRSFRNRFEHSLLDRHVGASLLRYLILGMPPLLDLARLERSADKLFDDLAGLALEDVTLERKAEVSISGIGAVTAPILARKDGRQWIFGVHGPLTPDVAPDDELREAKEFGSVPVRLIDDIVIARNLPYASRTVRDSLT